MSVIASWARKRWLELLWGAFTLANLLVTVTLVDYETVPFHFIWVSFTLLYGYRVYRTGTTFGLLALVMLSTGITLGWVVIQGPQGPDELTEVPLMGAMFLAMVWHARRRQTALDQVQRAADREREFVRDASHQLKTPITVARGFAELVRGAPTGADTARDIEIVIEELDRLGKVAGNMLLLTASEQAGSLVKGPIDLDELVESAVRRWRPSAQRLWRVDVRSAGTLEADRIRLDSVLDALIENAVRATDVNDAITLRAFADEGVAVLEVTDSGTGIPADYRARVFDRFWSTSTVDNGRSKRGAGLGLAIVKGIVEAHGGSVSLRSALGQGTTFTLRIPGFRPLADRPERPLAEQAVAAG